MFAKENVTASISKLDHHKWYRPHDEWYRVGIFPEGGYKIAWFGIRRITSYVLAGEYVMPEEFEYFDSEGRYLVGWKNGALVSFLGKMFDIYKSGIENSAENDRRIARKELINGPVDHAARSSVVHTKFPTRFLEPEDG